MGSAVATTVLWLMLICISYSVKSSQAKDQNCQMGEFECGSDGMCIERRKVCDGTWDCSNGQDENDCSMQGIFQNVGNKKTARFPVYKEVKGFDIYLRFTAVKCTGQLLEINSRGTKEYLRITLLEVGPIRVSFNTLRGRGQLDIAMRSKGSFCDGKRHIFSLTLFRGAVYYNVDRSSYVRYYVSRLGVPFSSPRKIVLGRGLQGCISGSTVIVRFNRTQEHVLGMSAGCRSVKKTTVRPSTPPVFTYSARKIATTTASAGSKCEPLTLTACKDLGYNLTQVPNALQHNSSYQASSEMSAFLSKLQSNCSPHLIPFLCQLYLPPCVLPQSAAPPCRSLCESVREDCALVNPNDRWPGHLNCDNFPRANDKAKCFPGSTKVTSKRTTLLRGKSVREEDLTETNSLKTAINKLKSHPTKPVKTETTAESNQTTANPGNRWPTSTVSENETTTKEKLSTDDKEKVFTEPPHPTASITIKLTDRFASTAKSVMTGQSIPVDKKTTANPGNRWQTSTVNANETTTKEELTTDDKEKAFTKPTASITRKLTDRFASAAKSVMTGQSTPVDKKGIRWFGPTRGRKSPSITARSYTRMTKHQRNETRIGNATMHRSTAKTNTSSHQFNSSSVLYGTPTSKNNAGGCGGVSVTPKGQLMSPGYPAGYPSNTTCRWLIALPNDYHVITFTFHRVYLEEDRNCVYDYIAVYDMLDNQVGQRYCGSITSPIHKDVKGNVAVVVFRSDSANSKKGFVLSYEARRCLTSAKIEN